MKKAPPDVARAIAELAKLRAIAQNIRKKCSRLSRKVAAHGSCWAPKHDALVSHCSERVVTYKRAGYVAVRIRPRR